MEINSTNIVMLTHDLSMTGAPRALFQFAQTLVKLGKHPVIVSPKSGPLEQDIRSASIPLYIMPDAMNSDALLRICMKSGMVIANTILWGEMIQLLNGTSIPVIWWIHEAEAVYSEAIVAAMPELLMNNIHIYVPGNYARETLLKRRPAYNVSELMYYIPDFSKDIDVPMKAEAKKQFAIIGSIENRKGQDIFISSFKLLSDEVRQQCCFTIAGVVISEAIHNKLTMLAQDYPENIHYYPGGLKWESICELYSKMDCLLCTSRDDPMPIVIAETMQLNKLVICSENTGFASLIQEYDAGFVYRNNDPVALARYITSICDISDEKYGYYAKNGDKLYRTIFTQAVFEQNLKAVLAEIEADSTPSPVKDEPIIQQNQRIIQLKKEKENSWHQYCRIYFLDENGNTLEPCLQYRYACFGNNKMDFQLNVPYNTKKISIDLCDDYFCMVNNLSCIADGKHLPVINSSGISIYDTYLFDSLAPQMEIDTSAIIGRKVHISFGIVLLENDNTLIESFHRLIEQQKAALEGLQNQYASLNGQCQELVKALTAHQNSTCWKITKPIRALGDRKNSILLKSPLLFSKLRINCWKLCGKAYTQRRIAKTFPHPVKISEEIRAGQEHTTFADTIKFSIIVPLYNTPMQFLKEMIASVLDQTYANWELCLADGSDSEHREVGKYCQMLASLDERIRYKKLSINGGISENTNASIEMSTGDYIGLFDHDDLLHPSALFEVMKAICEKKADFIYTDESIFHNVIEDAFCHHFKPDYAPDTLRANNYICHFTVFKKDLLDAIGGGFRKEYDGSQDFDMVLRLTEKAEKIVHIQQSLYYWRAHAGSVASSIDAKPYAITAAKKAVAAHLTRVHLEGEVMDSFASAVYRLKYKIIGEPLVSIIIPNKDHKDDLQKCIDSILTKSTYHNYEIIIVENNSEENEIFEYYKTLEANKAIRIVTWNGHFNYSAIINYGFGFANGEHILLLNNDVEVISEDWIQELLMYSQRSDVGAVGAKLYYFDNRVQHGGVGIGIFKIAGHLHRYSDRSSPGYMGRLAYAQNLSAVTAACMMIPRTVFEQVHGLDEGYEVTYNDIDLCMRIREAGYLIVWTPFAELYHYECKSRRPDNTPEKIKRTTKEIWRFQNRWRKELDAGDPYYNPNFSLDSEDFRIKPL